MKRGEDLLLSTRSIRRRIVESLLLIVGIALGIGAAGAGIAMMAGTAAESRELLASPGYREIVVSIREDAGDMELPAVAIDNESDLVLTTLDLKAAEEAPDVQYAYTANRTRYHLGDFRIPRPGQEPQRGEASDDPSSFDPAGFSPAEFPEIEEFDGYEVSPEFFSAWNMQAAEGSLFTEADMAAGEPLLIYGSELAADTGGGVGEQIVIRGEMYTVVGVLEPTGTEYDEMAFSPAFMPDLQGGDLMAAMFRSWGTTLCFAVADVERLEEAKEQLESYFSGSYGEGSVVISIPRAEAEAAKERASRLATVVLFLAVAGLLIASVNVSNILYSRAVRRHRSVGILKALGASMADVFRLFFSEALLLGGFGAVLGIGISVLLSKLMESTLGFQRIPPGVLTAGIVGAWAVTMALTVYPALQAARVPAAQAIRNE
jgi:putative ABC transport system permease protein